MVVTGLVIASPARLLDASLPLATMRTAMSRSVTAPTGLPSASTTGIIPQSWSIISCPFAAPSTLDLHYPQFDKIKDSDFAPAFDAGMASN
jgi:peptidyl-dipeptidase Dcp